MEGRSSCEFDLPGPAQQKRRIDVIRDQVEGTASQLFLDEGNVDHLNEEGAERVAIFGPTDMLQTFSCMRASDDC